MWKGLGEEMLGSGAGAVKDVRRGGNGLRVAVLLAALVGGLGSVATAQSEGEDEKLNELALVLAATYEDEEASFTLGIEYERDLGEFLAVMGVVEYVPDSESRELVFVVPFVLKPAGGLKLLAGPWIRPEGGESLPLPAGGRVVVRSGRAVGDHAGGRAGPGGWRRRADKGPGLRRERRIPVLGVQIRPVENGE